MVGLPDHRHPRQLRQAQPQRRPAAKAERAAEPVRPAQCPMGESQPRFLRKISLGGPYAVRAYPAGDASGDEGWIGNLEARYAVWPGMQAALFYDYGQTRANKRGWGSSTPAPARRARSGPGLATRPWPIECQRGLARQRRQRGPGTGPHYLGASELAALGRCSCSAALRRRWLGHALERRTLVFGNSPVLGDCTSFILKGSCDEQDLLFTLEPAAAVLASGQ